MSAVNAFHQLHAYLDSQVLGQPSLTEHLLIAILADGHLLVEGPPGLAKTRAVQALASGIEGDFQRIQFTPDLLPADLTGTDIYRPETGEFLFQQGPLFHNLILADEINRAPAKVQSALLEAMSERQISVGRNTYKLPALYTVMATQNPLEQEGTYPLPEAQLDRFLMHLSLDYPDASTEHKILQLTRSETIQGHVTMAEPLSQSTIFEARKALIDLHMANEVEAYLVALIMASRQPAAYCETLASWLAIGASPRATIALDRCARAKAWLAGRDFVTPDDIASLLHNILRHRIILSYGAEADGISADQVIDRILELVPAP
ncbi:MAG: MoxR family ATPase [Aliidiomarina sp.]|uniref:AAA family ATPase n=1 Tax=Aliidiomarina sp. TaxID=1872439 RepID=UPI0025B94BF8|nr:MoxR family ATPase [Aliidiomarina sp.]MCH8502521.1 MoxR family ATPase [Aliidiomarina sp.]